MAQFNGYKLQDIKDIKNYILGGRSDFRIADLQTGVEHFYKVKMAGVDKYQMIGNRMWFIRVQRGENYVYAGVLMERDSALMYSTGKKGVLMQTDEEIRGLLYVLRRQTQLPECLEVTHFGRCARCGRRLKNPESVATGIGSECIKKMGWL